MKRKLGAGDLSFLCAQIAVFLRSGVSLADGLKLLRHEPGGRRLKAAADGLADVVGQRKQLSEAMADGGLFPDNLIRMTKAGEVSGNLENVMENMARFYEREFTLTRRVREAVFYPLILLIMLGAAVGFIATRVLPMFGEILSDLGGELPGFVQWLTGAGLFLEQNYLWVIVFFAALAAAIFVVIHIPAGRLFVDRCTAKLPTVRKLAAARFAGAFGVLLSGGVAVNTALDLSCGLLKNKYMAARFDRARLNTNDMGDLLAEADIFPKKFTKMFEVGNESGESDAAMLKLATIYEAEAARALERLTGGIEPVLSAILSVLVGVILVSVILPLINIMSFMG